MKTEYGIRQSAKGAITKAAKIADEIAYLTGRLCYQGFNKDEMAKLRELIAELPQRVHEYNAYTNVADTEDAPRMETLRG